MLKMISTHTPLAGRDGGYEGRKENIYDFYSHAPRGARRKTTANVSLAKQFLLTRPSRGATKTDRQVKPDVRISTHTPLAGRDGLKMHRSLIY